jgi:hypothetical protein
MLLLVIVLSISFLTFIMVVGRNDRTGGYNDRTNDRNNDRNNDRSGGTNSRNNRDRDNDRRRRSRSSSSSGYKRYKKEQSEKVKSDKLRKSADALALALAAHGIGAKGSPALPPPVLAPVFSSPPPVMTPPPSSMAASPPPVHAMWQLPPFAFWTPPKAAAVGFGAAPPAPGPPPGPRREPDADGGLPLEADPLKLSAAQSAVLDSLLEYMDVPAEINKDNLLEIVKSVAKNRPVYSRIDKFVNHVTPEAAPHRGPVQRTSRLWTALKTVV